nr:GATA zinc finger domain-containing protein 14-like [Dermatophagoides farinae]
MVSLKMKISYKFMLLLFAAIILQTTSTSILSSSSSSSSSLINTTTESNHNNHHRYEDNSNYYIIDNNENFTTPLSTSIYPMSETSTSTTTPTTMTTTTTTTTMKNPVNKDLDIEESKNYNPDNNNNVSNNQQLDKTIISIHNNNSSGKWSPQLISSDHKLMSELSSQPSLSSPYSKPFHHYYHHQQQQQQQHNDNNQQSSDYYSNHHWPSVQVIIEDNNEIRLTSNNNHHHSDHNNHDDDVVVDNDYYKKLSQDESYQHFRQDTMKTTNDNNDGFNIDVKKNNNLDQKSQPQLQQQQHKEQSQENPFANFFKNLNEDFLNEFNSIDFNRNHNSHYQQQQQQQSSSSSNIDPLQYLDDDYNNNSLQNESNVKMLKSIQHPTRYLTPKLVSPSKIPDVYMPNIQQDSPSLSSFPKKQQETDNQMDFNGLKNEFTDEYHSPEKSLIVPVGARVHVVRDSNQPQSSSIVSKLDYNKNEPYKPSVIELPSSQPVLPIVFNFKTKLSPVITKTTHKSSPQSSSVQYFETHEPPHYREHIVHKPIFQDFKEIIVPYRVYVQEIQPVSEFRHTIASTTNPKATKMSTSSPMNPYSSSLSLSSPSSVTTNENPNPFQHFINQHHHYNHQHRPRQYHHSYLPHKRPYYHSYNHFNQLPMDYNPFLAAASSSTPHMEMSHLTKLPVYAPIEFNPTHTIHSPHHHHWDHNHDHHLVPIFGNSQQIPEVIDFTTATNLLSENIYSTPHGIDTAVSNYQKSKPTKHINNFNHFNF